MFARTWNSVIVIIVKYLRNAKINVSNVIYSYSSGSSAHEDFHAFGSSDSEIF